MNFKRKSSWSVTREQSARSFVRFHTLEDDDRILKISDVQNNGDWDYWLFIEVDYMDEQEDDPEYKYYVSLSVAAPAAASQSEHERAIDSWGVRDEDVKEYLARLGANWLAEVLHSYGVRAVLATWQGNNLGDILKDARLYADTITNLFGFFMDAPQNAVGASGWDLVAGNQVPTTKEQ
jgi:hypothetical protein